EVAQRVGHVGGEHDRRVGCALVALLRYAVAIGERGLDPADRPHPDVVRHGYLGEWCTGCLSRWAGMPCLPCPLPSVGLVVSTLPPAEPRAASRPAPRPASPRPASPRSASPRPASPRPGPSRPASSRLASTEPLPS